MFGNKNSNRKELNVAKLGTYDDVFFTNAISIGIVGVILDV